LTITDEALDLWLKKLEDIDVWEGDTEINGLRVSVNEESSFRSSEVVQFVTLLDYDIQFKRIGYKEISYDSWVDTNWCSWERVE